jgi:hypothetical protein
LKWWGKSRRDLKEEIIQAGLQEKYTNVISPVG